MSQVDVHCWPLLTFVGDSSGFPVLVFGRPINDVTIQRYGYNKQHVLESADKWFKCQHGGSDHLLPGFCAKLPFSSNQSGHKHHKNKRTNKLREAWKNGYTSHVLAFAKNTSQICLQGIFED